MKNFLVYCKLIVQKLTQNISTMILKRPQKPKRVSLKGAVQINRNSYFVYADEGGKMFLKNGNDERLQKAVVKNMIALNPSISDKFHEELMRRYGISVFPSVLMMEGNGAPYAKIVGPSRTCLLYTSSCV